MPHREKHRGGARSAAVVGLNVTDADGGNGHRTNSGRVDSADRNGRPVPSKSFLSLNTSALYSVFGSQASLAELTGDTLSRPVTPNNQLTDNTQSTPSALRANTGSPINVTPRHTRSDSTSWVAEDDAALGDTNASFEFSSATGVMGKALTLLKITVLFVFGVAYGQFSKRLHDNHMLTTHTFDIASDQYSLIWGSCGVMLGLLLPLVDKYFPEDRKKYYGKGGADWTSIVRAGAAFLGIAYGVRKIPWASTPQVAFYWGMINPCLWFLLDATRNGFILSSVVALAGTRLFVLFYPDNIPSPTTETYVSVFTLVASAFFCCSICIGNLGRRLQV